MASKSGVRTSHMLVRSSSDGLPVIGVKREAASIKRAVISSSDMADKRDFQLEQVVACGEYSWRGRVLAIVVRGR